jgi:hypothetical protein
LPGNAAGNADNKSTVSTPRLVKILPGAPLLGPTQPLILTGSNFQDKVVVKFTDFQGNSTDAKVASAAPDRLVLTASFDAPGGWKVTAANPGGAESPPLEFQVANVPLPDYSWRVGVFIGAAGVVTILLGTLFLLMFCNLKTAQENKQWSFGDALSEESVYQPKEIRQKSDIIMFASSSRLIALLGLLGILTIVVGIGYSIMWNLFLFGSVPDLSQVRSFLYGAACLFAPYLANQLSGLFTPAAKSTPTDIPASTKITGIGPASPDAAAGVQPVQITGEGFQAGLTLTLVDPQGSTINVANPAITDVHPTVINVNLTLSTPGAWKIAVLNPLAQPSSAFSFTVAGAPTITGTDPAQLSRNPAEQLWTFLGTGFMSGLTVVLTNPQGGGTTVTTISVTATAVKVKAILPTPGQWQAVITNPKNRASLTYPLNIT